MEWFNVFGLVFTAVILTPNVVFAIKHKGKTGDRQNNRIIEVFEQIGRYGCMLFMVFNVPGTFFGWRSGESFALYLIVDSVLVVSYCVLWAVLWNKDGFFKSLSLSAIPSVLFLFSGIMSNSVLLIFSSLLFAPMHIYISLKNTKPTPGE
ncbi:MAG: hypothetical protein IJU39_01665 [Clostridia bacterium]|nr:hypothetical protein [Clostridia bacterium]